MPPGRAPKVPRRTGRDNLGCEQAYWIPYVGSIFMISFTGVTAVDDKERVEEGLKLDLLRCFRGTGFLREPADFSFVFETNWSDKYCQ